MPHFHTDLEPMPAPRPRVSRHGTHNPAKYTAWKQRLAAEYMQWMRENGKDIIEDGPIDLDVLFVYEVPKSRVKKFDKSKVFQYHIKRIDISNLVKSVEDALNGVAYKDDCQIACITAGKIEIPPGGTGYKPGIYIDMTSLQTESDDVQT